MPALWKNMSPDMQAKVFNIIQEFYDEARQADGEPLSVKNIRKLIPFLSFNKTPNIRGCLLFDLDHMPVFLDPVEPLTDIQQEDTHQQHLSEDFQGYTWLPKAHIEKYKKRKKSNKHDEENSFCNESL